MTVGLTAVGSAKPAAKVSICHHEGNGSFHIITVSSNASPAHYAHGDAAPGQYFTDADGDGFGAGGSASACPLPGSVDNDDDCDDGNPLVGPGLPEIPYNGADDDCDPTTLDDDLDQDGAGGDTDCDDGDPGRYPGNAEVCGDGIDQSCDGVVDEGCVVDCPCFTTGDLDEADDIDASSLCWQESAPDSEGYTAAGIYFRTDVFDYPSYNFEFQKFYAYGWDGNTQKHFCLTEDIEIVYDYETGVGDEANAQTFLPITAAEERACETLVLDWAAEAGMVCEQR